MAQVSSVDSDFSARREAQESHPASPASSTDDGKKKSLLSKVKDKAKGTVRKITSKVTKDRTAGQEVESESDGEVEGSDVQSSGSKGDRSLASDGAKDGLKDGPSPQGNPEGDMLSTFARSDGSENSPLVAEPTTYSDGRGFVDAVMPSPVIEPASASELGEQSSQNLGEIPEAKEDEKTAAKEVLEGGQESDTGFKRTFNQKDLQAIDGLPKPGGFDLHNESSVKSNFSIMSSDSGMLETTDFTDEAQPRESEHRAEGAIKGRDREYFPEGLKSVDSETPHPPGTDADFGDSMFSSKFSSGMNPNEPAAGEAQHANEIGTWSRGDETQSEEPKPLSRGVHTRSTEPSVEGSEESRQHPPAADTSLHENMFSTAIASDLKPDTTDGSSSTSAKETESIGEGTSKGADREFPSESLKNVDNETSHPPGSNADFHDSMFSSHASTDLNSNEPNAAEAQHANEIGTWSRGDETEAKETEPIAEGASKGADREFFPEGLKSVDAETPHPPGTDADFGDSMFSSKFSSDMNPNEPTAGEALHANEIGTWSRGDETQSEEPKPLSRGVDPGSTEPSVEGSEESRQHPPAADTSLHENMFSTAIASDLKPDVTDGSSSTSAKEEASTPVQGGAVRGAFDTKEQDVVPTEKGAIASKPKPEAQENEDFYDALSDDETATQRSIDTKSGKDFKPEATDEEVPATPSFNPEEPEKEVSEDPKDSSHTEQSSASVTSSFMSVVGALGAKVSQYTSHAQTPATEKDAPSTTEKEAAASTTETKGPEDVPSMTSALKSLTGAVGTKVDDNAHKES